MFPPVIPVSGAGRPRVTHPSAADVNPEGPLIARLACIKRAASVHPEPRSNSPYFFSSCSFRYRHVYSFDDEPIFRLSCHSSAVKVRVIRKPMRWVASAPAHRPRQLDPRESVLPASCITLQRVVYYTSAFLSSCHQLQDSTTFPNSVKMELLTATRLSITALQE